ncbi:MAG: hypothetical protein DWP98_03420 [Bacteroidetes bacterium]|nr:MAG: hypothetical protein DWP98_03420 [Bacteroidota bacterium]MBL1143671.1 hypothetical protein [Bacteroidota bacterium]
MSPEFQSLVFKVDFQRVTLRKNKCRKILHKCKLYVKYLIQGEVHFCKMALHKGAIIEKAVRSVEYPISLLAKKMGKSRRHIYDLFAMPNVSMDTILKIGLIINYDFSKDFKRLVNIPKDYQYAVLQESSSTENSTAYWRNKYLELLENHQILLEKHQLLLEKNFKSYFGKKEE